MLIGPVKIVGSDEPFVPKVLLEWKLGDPRKGKLKVSPDSLSAIFVPSKAPGHLGLVDIHFNTNISLTGGPQARGIVMLNVVVEEGSGLTAEVKVIDPEAPREEPRSREEPASPETYQGKVSGQSGINAEGEPVDQHGEVIEEK